MPAPTKDQSRDGLVQLTNDGSIVSKRSVERIYMPNSTQYLRFFVKKYQRRTPLVNRGYFLRMRLIDTMVDKFLSRPAAGNKAKVVVNLGCGSDPLPWRAMARHPDRCKGVRFVDIDFPNLMMLKNRVVETTPELRQPLTNVEFLAPGPSSVILKSNEYTQISCDLRRLDTIHAALVQTVDVANCEFLFVAEVSITYMETADADALIQWAGTLGDSEFCLLEQLAPDGLTHPFAHAMTQHFVGMNTPLFSVGQYPTVADQKRRFASLGWHDARIWTLWDAWMDPLFMTAEDREALDQVEVFDEWEEFITHTSHYFLLYARNGHPVSDEFKAGETQEGQPPTSVSNNSPFRLHFDPVDASKSSPPRRFGAPLVLKDILGQTYAANAFGYGAAGRLRSYDIYGRVSSDNEPFLPVAHLHQGGPAARSGFTLTDLGDAGYLLAGGRTSPAAPLGDCWLFKKDANQWSRTHDLPVPLFRHTAVRLGTSQLVLLAGGKLAAAAIHPGMLVFHPALGWLPCTVEGDAKPADVFGPLLLSLPLASTTTFHGLMSGGIALDGTVSTASYEWTVDVSIIHKPAIRFRPARRWTSLLCRFGASSVQVGDWTLVTGGVDSHGCIAKEREILCFKDYGQDAECVEGLDYARTLDRDTPRPVLVGTSLVSTSDDEAILLGGGMATFSMPMVWSTGVYTIRSSQPVDKQPWRLLKTLSVTNTAPEDSGTFESRLLSVAQIPHITLDADDQFRSVLQSGKPVVFKGVRLGDCMDKWTLSYLATQTGADRKVVVHESASQAMDFLAKNFRYTTQTFAEFIAGVEAGKKLYLRALSADKPSDAPANLDADFPTIAPDFVLPNELRVARERLFSSVLRISGPVNMWLHYDVLANVYCQIHGTKRFYLFPPSDVTRLGFAPGASSSSIDVFSSLDASSLSQCHPHEAVLGPGDVLFLPQLWLHTATPISNSSIAVNVFFRDLDAGYSAGRDVYGNRDLAAYERARQDIAKMAGSFKNLPRDTRDFYLRRLADELLQADE